MPITSSAKKALRSSERKRVFNVRRKRVMKNAVKEVKEITKVTKEEAGKLLSMAQKAIDKAAKRGVIKKKNASRKIKRLATSLKKKVTGK